MSYLVCTSNAALSSLLYDIRNMFTAVFAIALVKGG